MRRRILLSLASCLVLSCSTWTSANAAMITVFSDDPSGWAAAISNNIRTEDFSSTTLIAGLFVSSTVGTNFGGHWDDVLKPGVNTTTWSFAPATIAFGGNWDLTPGGPGTGIAFTVTFLDNTTQSISAEIPASFSGQFFGFVSDVPFKSVLETNGTQGGNAESYSLDNLVFASDAALAAPGPIAGGGLPGLATFGALLVWYRKRRAVMSMRSSADS